MIRFIETISDEVDLHIKLKYDYDGDNLYDFYSSTTKGYLVADSFEELGRMMENEERFVEVNGSYYCSIIEHFSGEQRVSIETINGTFECYHSLSDISKYKTFTLSVIEPGMVVLRHNGTVLPCNLSIGERDLFVATVDQSFKDFVISEMTDQWNRCGQPDITEIFASYIESSSRCVGLHMVGTSRDVEIPLSNEIIDKLRNKVPANFRLSLKDGVGRIDLVD